MTATKRIDLAVWEPDPDRKGLLRHVRQRTLGEVGAELCNALNVIVCEKCGKEEPYRHQFWARRHARCGGEWKEYIDEYFHGPNTGEESQEIPKNEWGIACWAVTGGSEGHYVHVEIVYFVPDEVDAFSPDGMGTRKVRLVPRQHLAKRVRLAMGKTFRGMAYAQKIAARCAELLGA